jgi:hypothetical protein
LIIFSEVGRIIFFNYFLLKFHNPDKAHNSDYRFLVPNARGQNFDLA